MHILPWKDTRSSPICGKTAKIQPKVGGGILVYTKTGLSVTKLDNNCNFTQYCTFKLHDIIFYLIYRSPNAPPESIDYLANLLRTAGKNSVFIGDFNLPEVDWETGRAPARLGSIIAGGSLPHPASGLPYPGER